MENNSFYFENKNCEYYPCHKGLEGSFNCLFCYCPLYPLGDKCGGNFSYTEKGIKDCSKCLVPHSYDAYKKIGARFSELALIAGRRELKISDAVKTDYGIYGNELKEYIAAVSLPDEEAAKAAGILQSRLAKPPGSLGRLEEFSIQLAGITGKIHNHIEKKKLLVFAADNGVTEEGVSSAPQSVTLKQTINLTRGKTGAAVLCKSTGCDITVCDVGVNADITEQKVLNKKIAYGTFNIAKGPAMTKAQAAEAVVTGIKLAADSGADVIGVGEMGIGNTTTAAAVLSVITGLDPESITGRGGGITDTAFEKKKEVIKRATEINRPDKDDIIDVLSKVGGLDIAAMCGAFIGAAGARIPVVIDGFISAVAALCAVSMCPNVRYYLIPGHDSCEPGYKKAVEAMGLRPVLNLEMRLGEGSGCPLVFETLEAACAIINDMATFEKAGIDDGYLDEIRENGGFGE